MPSSHRSVDVALLFGYFTIDIQIMESINCKKEPNACCIKIQPSPLMNCWKERILLQFIGVIFKNLLLKCISKASDSTEIVV